MAQRKSIRYIAPTRTHRATAIYSLDKVLIKAGDRWCQTNANQSLFA